MRFLRNMICLIVEPLKLNLRNVWICIKTAQPIHWCSLAQCCVSKFYEFKQELMSLISVLWSSFSVESSVQSSKYHEYNTLTVEAIRLCFRRKFESRTLLSLLNSATFWMNRESSLIKVISSKSYYKI